MLFLLRKIRRKLMQKNKITTYLLYAIGEIILVVIGIMIAVYLNNLNQKNSQRQELKIQLNTLYSEIQGDSIYFSNRLKQDSTILRYLKAVSRQQYEKVDLSSLLFILIINENPREFGQMTNRLKQNGLYELIESIGLKEELSNYTSSLDHYNEYASWHKNYITNNIEGYIVKTYPLDTLMRIPKSVALDGLKNKNLQSLVSFQRTNYKGHIANKLDASSIAKDILMILRTEYDISSSYKASTKEIVIENQLPDPLTAGWEGESVCEVVEENANIRVLKCTFPPGVGHEKHYHNPHVGYTLAGGRFQMTDSSGTREVNVPTGSSFGSEKKIFHEVLNVGETTAEFLIIEYK